MNVNYISIDPSLRGTGLYYCGCAGVISTKSKKTPREAKENIYAVIRDVCSAIKPDICLIEDYSRMGSSNGTLSAWAVAEVRGIITAIMIEHQVPMVSVPIPMWKSLTGVKEKKSGAGWKENYLNVVADKFGIRFGSPDAADAYMIYWTAQRIYETGGRTAAQKRLYAEIVEAIGHERLL